MAGVGSVDIWLAGETALEVIRKVRTSDALFLEPVSRMSVRVREASGQPVPAAGTLVLDFEALRGAFGRVNFLALGLSSPPTLSRPAYVRVPKASDRRRAGIIHCLVIPGKLPPGAVLQLKSRVAISQGLGQLGGGQPCIINELFDGCRVFVDSPALACTAIASRYQSLAKANARARAKVQAGAAKAQPAAGASASKAGVFTLGDAMVRLVETVMELTGHYGRDPANPSANSVTENLPSFTSVEDMRALLVEPSHWRGAKLLFEALGYARNGSRSPMETCLWIVLTMPRSYGLYGLGSAKFNVAVVPSVAQRSMMRHKTLTPDIYWEALRTAVEYQGDGEHSTRSARAEDNRRLNDYLVCGIRAHFVCFEDVRTPRAFDRLALEIARSMEVQGFPAELGQLSRFLEDDEAGVQRARHLSYLLPPVNR